jgi:hypothetical protein
MARHPQIAIAGFLILGFLLARGALPAAAQFADAPEDVPTTAAAPSQASGTPLLSADDLRALVAPVALYPDELLAVVLPAATNPLQVVEAQRLLAKKNSDPSLQPDADWDPAIIALLNYPQVVQQLNDDLGWTQDLGNAVMDQQKDVLDAIQAARSAASDAGYLQSNDQQTVVNNNENIVIESKEPNVVYVPTYDPAPIVNNTYVNYPPPVYSPPYPSYYAPAATFFAGAFVGAAFAYGFDWDNDDIDIDNDIDLSRGDVNIGSGNTNIDRSKLENRFNGETKPGAKGNMKWSPAKARQKSTTPRRTAQGRTQGRTQAAARPTSANIASQLGGGTGKARANQPARVKPSRSVQQQSSRGNASLAGTRQSKQQLQKSAARKQQMQRRQQQQRPQRQVQSRQLKQSRGGGGAFGQMPPFGTAKAQSSRGDRSLGGGGGRPSRGGGRR